MVLTVARMGVETTAILADFEVLLVDTVCWDFTFFHKFHDYSDMRQSFFLDQEKLTLRKLRLWMGQSISLPQAAESELLLPDPNDPTRPMSRFPR
eukprot:4162906-Karenia_brevis.AAC.1